MDRKKQTPKELSDLKKETRKESSEIEKQTQGQVAETTEIRKSFTVANEGWEHLFNNDIISMPDKWEFPWVRNRN